MEKTIRDLCKRVAATGMLDKLDNETVVQYQDLIGHATVQENSDIANTPELMESFYRIYGAAYGVTSAIKYYVDHSDKMIDLRYDLGEYKAISEKQADEIKKLNDDLARVMNELSEAKQDIKTSLGETEFQKTIVKVTEEENTRLKAELYDLMKEVEQLKRKE